VTEVGHDPVTPPPHLIAEQAEAADHPGADGPLRHDPSSVAELIGDRCHLHQVAACRKHDLEDGVVDVTARTAADGCVHGFVDDAVEVDEPITCAERDPVEVD
jgi:hypothetical protein